MTSGRTSNRPVRVVLVDDSTICRHQLREILHAEGLIEVVGETARGEETLALLEQHKPDLLVVDLVMPGQGGQETIALVMAKHPLPILVLTAQPEGVRQVAVFDAIRRGALDLAEKPRRGDKRAEDSLRRSILTLAQVPVVHHVAGNRPSFARSAGAQRPAPVDTTRGFKRTLESRAAIRATQPLYIPATIDGGESLQSTQAASETIDISADTGLVVGIGASAGGPTPLAALLAGLPSDFNAVIAVVQHLPVGFTNAFVEYLRGRIALPVKTVHGREPLRSGTVYLPGDDSHLVAVGPRHFSISNSPPVEGHRPSVDVLLNSLAGAFGRRCIGIILSGIGQDGVRGLSEIRDQGGLTLAQSEETCAVFGMPQAAQNTGAARYMMAPEAMAVELQRQAAAQGVWRLAT